MVEILATGGLIALDGIHLLPAFTRDTISPRRGSWGPRPRAPSRARPGRRPSSFRAKGGEALRGGTGHDLDPAGPALRHLEHDGDEVIGGRLHVDLDLMGGGIGSMAMLRGTTGGLFAGSARTAVRRYVSGSVWRNARATHSS